VTLSSREKWIFVLTVMKTSQMGKAMPMKMKQATCEYIRNKMCKDIDYPEWLKIEYDIKDLKGKVMDILMKGVDHAMGEAIKLPPDAQQVFDEAEFARFDDAVREEMKNIDLEELMKNLPKDKSKQMGKIKELFEKVMRAKKDLK
jgi:hypothetical protein